MTLCEVCSTELSKYRCPTCNVQSCSLACTQSHKIYCTPKASEQGHEPEKRKGLLDNVQNGTSETAPGGAYEGTADPSPQLSDNPATNTFPNPNIPRAALQFKDLESSQALKDLFARFPTLRSQLRDIYKLTLEEEWVEMKHSNYGRGRGRGRGGFTGRGGRSRGPWNEEKGFNRGLGKVRRLRETLESNNGAANSTDIEGFRQFTALVLVDNNTPRDIMQLQPEG
ncbi:hypothetical protein EMCG_00464 [[Emmonsia] crescens]|uniref:HIT-type domain-containing protein n=1 Tax=[Emmonsia] crescens TaxID=73230 RepID=A0A0G2J0A0_9EURO|nr:hypothetical protein EMCG_00464 [Emmonsia crescens UAMH 3008]